HPAAPPPSPRGRPATADRDGPDIGGGALSVITFGRERVTHDTVNLVDRPAKVRPLHRSARSARLSALGGAGGVAALGRGRPGAVPAGAAPAPAPEVPGAGPGQAPVLSPIPDQGPPTDPVHRLAGGCYTVADADTGRLLSRDGADGYVLTDDAAAAEPFRTRAAALGRFLFYGADHTVVTVDGDRVRAADSPTA